MSTKSRESDPKVRQPCFKIFATSFLCEIIDIQSKPPSSKHPKSPRNEKVATAVPIIFDYSSQNEKPKPDTPPEPFQKNTQIAKVASKIEREATPGNTIAGEVNKVNPKGKLEKESGKSGVHIEDRFTEYINRSKLNIRTMSKSSEGNSVSGKDKDKLSDNSSGKDKFSDYIDRTKNKLRTTSGIGDEEGK
ncbi:hypothetical protein GH714_024480 [Hevea brasiliensis]|uniref:Uncharacterized protein n=1 Tax=Hevea brasiliensis TaxID=3981 RepID=A0A6A6LEC1_HEVBR|nr:hypothetical protein GH714_024480 [Hevea brasiliensis]